MAKKKKGFKAQLKFWVTFFVGVTFAFFMWLVWQKLTAWIGNSWIVLGITGVLILMAMFTGYFSFNKIVEKFS